MVQLIKKFQTSSLTIQALFAFLGLSLYAISSYFLETSYASSKFPVPYFVQQTSFDAPQMKSWYAYMLEQGTFDIYLTTQFIDFAFIAAVIFAGFTTWTLVSNLFSQGSFFNRIGHKMAFALPLAGLFDILENIVSFFMLAKPLDFAEGLIIPYSSFAVLKFACWTVALIWLALSLLALPIHTLYNKRSKNS